MPAARVRRQFPGGTLRCRWHLPGRTRNRRSRPSRCCSGRSAPAPQIPNPAAHEPPLQIPLELGRQIVYGAIGYARELGFEPHPDFEQAAGYLEPWDGHCDLTFGLDGKPTYISGPYDDAERVMRRLHRSVGAGNYHITHAISR